MKNKRKKIIPRTLQVIVSGFILGIGALYALKNHLSAAELGRTRIPAGQGFEELIRLDVNGNPQWLLARTRNPAAPILLKLHGGPGAATMPFARESDELYLANFIVVHWDRRAGGKSFNLLRPFEPAGIPEQLADLTLIVRYLVKKYNRPNLVLFAESYGTIIGALYAAAHPELIGAYIGVGQIYDQRATEKIRFAYLEEQARKRGDARSLAALQKINFPHSLADLFILNRELYACGCGLFRKPPGGPYGIVLYDLRHTFSSPEYSFIDALLYEPAANLLSTRSMEEVLRFQMPPAGKHFRVPVFLIAGEFDYMTPIPLARLYFQTLSAPEKKFFEIKDAAHIVGFDAPAELARIVNSISIGSDRTIKEGPL